MAAEAMRALREAIESNAELREEFAQARTVEDIQAVARAAGVDLSAVDAASDLDLSDSDLESVSGGYTFPATDWIYCDNPWTNAYCTLRC